MDLSNDTLAFNATTTPMVVRIMPLPGSLASIGYIYDPNPAQDGDGGLLAAASAFFTNQGHQVFHDPCPDLAAYHKDRRVTATIIDMDWLPNHILAAGLDLLKTTSPSSDADPLGTSFMVAYLLTLAPAAPWGLISPSPMGGNLKGRTLSINRHGGTGGSARSFHSAPPPSLVPSRSTRSVGASSHPPASQGGTPTRILNPTCTHPAWSVLWASAVLLPRLAMGGGTAVRAAGQLHPLCPPSANHLLIPRFSGVGLTLPTCPIGGACCEAMPLSRLG
jgi:hypothetical protein